MADPIARLEDVSRSYHAGAIAVDALRSVSLEVERGDYVAVMGPSGSGKSTLLHILGCLDRPTSGRYLLGGRDVSALTDRELAGIRNREIGFEFQRFPENALGGRLFNGHARFLVIVPLKDNA